MGFDMIQPDSWKKNNDTKRVEENNIERRWNKRWNKRRKE